jgi:alpha-beta hydrolase superfamily lysophospholipase
MLLWIGAALFALIVLLLAVVTLVVYHSLHPARWTLRVSPKDDGLEYEDVRFPSKDGINLAGWWVPAERHRATIVLCHGYPSNRADVLPAIPFLHEAGYDILAFDFRRLGESEGRMTTIGLREPLDLHGAVTFARSRRDKPIGVLGLSMGAATALMEAADDPRVEAVVADSPFANLAAQVPRRFGSGAAAGLMGRYACWLGGCLIGERVGNASPLGAIPRIAPRPVLLIHGDADRVIPDADSRALYAAARQPKQLWIVPGAGHVEAFGVERAEYVRRVLAFFCGALGG